MPARQKMQARHPRKAFLNEKRSMETFTSCQEGYVNCGHRVASLILFFFYTNSYLI